MEYHELETFNGDSSSISVVEPQFSMENLQVIMIMMMMMMLMITMMIMLMNICSLGETTQLECEPSATTLSPSQTRPSKQPVATILIIIIIIIILGFVTIPKACNNNSHNDDPRTVVSVY